MELRHELAETLLDAERQDKQPGGLQLRVHEPSLPIEYPTEPAWAEVATSALLSAWARTLEQGRPHPRQQQDVAVGSWVLKQASGPNPFLTQGPALAPERVLREQEERSSEAGASQGRQRALVPIQLRSRVQELVLGQGFEPAGFPPMRGRPDWPLAGAEE